MSESQTTRARRFQSLHHGDRVLILPNAWDVLSARVFEAEGFPAIGTTSFGIARAHGRKDGEDAARACSLDMVRLMAAALTVPLTADIEAGYGRTPEEVEATARAFIEAGAVGFNIEDGRSNRAAPLLDVDRQCERIAALRRAAEATSVPVFINARTDVYWLETAATSVRLDTALERALAYRSAGADGIFIPGLNDAAAIREAVRAVGVPLNLLAGPKTPPVPALQELAVKRLSLGSGPVRATMGLLKEIAGELRAAGTYGYLERAMPYDEANEL